MAERLVNHLKVERARLDLTQADLAERAGVTRKTINTIENGVFVPSTLLALRIAKVGDKPYRLLEAVEGLQLMELPEATSCCGFGGTFSMKNAQTSTAMLADKMANVMSTKAEVLVAGDYSCLMHIGGLLSRMRAGVKPIHLAEILAQTEDAVLEVAR